MGGQSISHYVCSATRQHAFISSIERFWAPVWEQGHNLHLLSVTASIYNESFGTVLLKVKHLTVKSFYSTDSNYQTRESLIHAQRLFAILPAVMTRVLMNVTHHVTSTHHLSIYIYIYTHNMWPWTTKSVLSRWGMFVAIAKNTLYGSKLYIFSFMPKCSMKIFCKFLTVNISKLNFWLVICIAKNFIWTTLKVIFSIFRFFCTLRFQIYK